MITGNTRVLGIIGDPVAHVRTPQIMNAQFAGHGIDAVIVPMHVAGAGLASVLAAARQLQNLAGLVVTVPHKTAVVDLCDEVRAEARLVGAANAIRRSRDGRLVCDMFDGQGFLGGLLAQGIDSAERRVLLLGAGGAASAIAITLAGRGVGTLTIANRTRDKARALAARVAAAFPACRVTDGPPDPTGHDLVVNATSLGLRADDPLPLDPDLLRPDMTVAEVVMKPERTAFIEAAQARGCRVHTGRHMLDAQVRLLAGFLGVATEAADFNLKAGGKFA
ncbi:MAG: shikimate dehydrogenase [Hyphomicrobiaceae bacterium]|nr:shikimate dehydrogenase [Hyphomicrobiaceae bacterium]